MTPADQPSAGAWKTLAIAALAVFIVSLDGTALFVAFPSITQSFPGVSSEALSWVLNVYTIGYGALLVPAGRLADRFGRRAFFLIGVACFVVASVLCSFAPESSLLIAARGLQSLGAAMLVPASFALVLHAFPLARRGVAIGIWGAVGALAAALGPGVGSAIVQFSSWRWVFLLNVPLGAWAIFSGVRRLVESRSEERGDLPDAIGAALLAGSFGALAYGIVGARAYAVVAGGALLALFVWRSLAVPTPALDLRLFARRSFAIANGMTLVFSVAFTAMFFGNVYFLTEHWGLGIFEAGMWISPGPLTVIPVAILAGRGADRFGYRRLFVLGGLLFAAGGAWLLLCAQHAPAFLLWLPGTVVMGIAIGMVLPSLSGASALELDSASFGVGSGVNQAVRQLGSVLGVALVVLSVHSFAESERFEILFSFLVAGGLATTLGGALLNTRKAATRELATT